MKIVKESSIFLPAFIFPFIKIHHQHNYTHQWLWQHHWSWDVLSGTVLLEQICSNKTVLRLDFCSCLNVKLYVISWGFSLLKFQPIGDSFTFKHLQKSCFSTVLLKQKACPNFSDSNKYNILRSFSCYVSTLQTRFSQPFPGELTSFLGSFKAENVTISKLTLFVKIRASSPKISGFKHDRAFILRHPVCKLKVCVIESLPGSFYSLSLYSCALS